METDVGNGPAAGSPPDSTQTAPDHKARKRRFSGTMAFQHQHRRHHGVDQRTLRGRSPHGRGRLVRPTGSCILVVRGSAHAWLCLLAPFAPYLAHELWEMLGEKGSLLAYAWPKYDPALAKEEEIEIPVQINGKLRSRIVVPADAPENVVRERALSEAKIKATLGRQADCEGDCGSDKLVNIVVR